jgi:hypothetical protein
MIQRFKPRFVHAGTYFDAKQGKIKAKIAKGFFVHVAHRLFHAKQVSVSQSTQSGVHNHNPAIHFFFPSSLRDLSLRPLREP